MKKIVILSPFLKVRNKLREVNPPRSQNLEVPEPRLEPGCPGVEVHGPVLPAGESSGTL